MDETDIQLYSEWLETLGIPCAVDPVCCDEVVDINGYGATSILDLLYLIEYVRNGGLAPPPCGEYSGSDDYCYHCTSPDTADCY